MKDYSNYRSPTVDKVKWSAYKLFQQQLKSEGTSILIEGNKQNAIVRNHSNPTNEHKEERYLILSKDVDINRGYMVKYMDNDYIVISDIDKDNPFYNTSKLRKFNHLLKWIDKDGNIQTHIALVNNEQLYTTGVKEDKFIQWGNSKESILLPNNEITKTVYEDMRLIINRHCWKVTFINEDDKGLLTIMCEQDEFNSNTDNLELGIADYYKYQNHYDFKILNKNPILSTLGTSTTIDIQCFQNDIKVDNPILKYTISNEGIVKIEDNKIIGLKYGTCKLTIEYEGIQKSVDVQILENETNNFITQIEGKSTLAWGRKATYKVTFVDNGQPYNDVCEFTLTDENGKETKLAKITKIDKENCTCTIQANHNQDEGIVLLHCKNRIGNEEIKKIEIISAWI
ncbi:hypothetical protein G8S21_04975 [Clostridium botulinum C]|uniref:hypothetical protein n=1 Tax=Clostridium botulinum TaxID=1491 RepID=UPI001E33D64E|nr:hypothetical protein [Clostridium botulinum]MCD3245302.1 hypothetical protein [Clostridium botulinum C]MCD3261681.1 hypothetical protein [Clostridium botulinum C]